MTKKKGSSSSKGSDVRSSGVEAEDEFRARPFAQMDIVDRPQVSRKNAWEVDHEAEEIARTVQTPGKAVRLAFRNMEHIVKVQMALRGRVAKHGLVMRYKTDAEDRLVCWAEKPAKPAEKPKEKKT